MIPATLRIFVCTEAIDMRQGFDRLAQLVKTKLGEDPQAGSLFVFANRNATRLKALWFDSNGYCLLYKRLHLLTGIGNRGYSVKFTGEKRASCPARSRNAARATRWRLGPLGLGADVRCGAWVAA